MKAISQLKTHGFDVTRITATASTVIEHENLFIVEGTHGPVQAVKNEDTNKYTITFSSLCTSDNVPYEVNMVSCALLASINESANQTEQRRIDALNVQPATKVTVTFKDVWIGETFSKPSSSSTYIKIDEQSYAKQSSIASTMLMFMEADDNVEVDPFNVGLTDEQKWDIVFSVPERAAPEDVAKWIMMDLDNIPGVEDLDDRDKHKVANELLAMWCTHHNM